MKKLILPTNEQHKENAIWAGIGAFVLLIFNADFLSGGLLIFCINSLIDTAFNTFGEPRR